MPRHLHRGSGTSLLWEFLLESSEEGVYTGSQQDMAIALDFTLNRVSKAILLLRRYGLVESLTGRNSGRWRQKPCWRITQ